MAHQIFEFTDTQYDDHFMPISFTDDQNYPSPVLMRQYEIEDWISSTGFFLQHESMANPSAPDRTGMRVRAYAKKLRHAKWLVEMDQVFCGKGQQSKQLKTMCAVGVDASIVGSVSKLIDDKLCKEVLDCAKSFQKDAVKHWNPHIGEVTMASHVGLVAIDEGASAECGALSLDLLHKFGIIVKDNGSYSVAPDFKAKRAYLFGDVKTVDNIDKFVSLLVVRD